MASAISSGCDAFAVPSGASVAGTEYDSQTSVGNNQGGTYVGKMTFFAGYVDVITAAQVSDMNAHGVAVCLFYENTIGLGPQGALGYTPTMPGYFTYQQGLYDGAEARSLAVAQLSWPTNRPIYYTTDFASTSANVPAIQAYFQGVAQAEGSAAYVGMYGNAGTMEQIRLAGYASYFWQNESLGEWNNGTLYPYASVWQVYTGGSLAVGGVFVDGDFAWQAPQVGAGDFGQYPYSGSPPPPPPSNGTGATATTTSTTVNVTPPPAQLSIAVPEFNYDKVIFSETFSGSVANTVSLTPQVNFLSVPHSLNQLAYPIGIYSFDGATYTDLGVPPTKTPSYVFTNSSAAVIVWATVTMTEIQFNAQVNQTVGGGGTIPITVKVALLANPNPSPISGATLTQNLSYASVSKISSYATYRRILTDTSVSQNGTDNSQVTVSTGLTNTVPNLLYWDLTASDVSQPQTFYDNDQGVAFGIYMDSSNIYYRTQSGFTSSWAYRIYRDN